MSAAGVEDEFPRAGEALIRVSGSPEAPLADVLRDPDLEPKEASADSTVAVYLLS